MVGYGEARASMGDGGTEADGARERVVGSLIPMAVLARVMAERRVVSSTTLSNSASCFRRLPDVGISVERDRYGEISP
jgi:hypothetical protein